MSDTENKKLRIRNVLLIDDSPTLRRILGQLISNNYSVNIHEANDGVEGLSIVSQLRSELDLIICDLKMPKMNGKAFLENISTSGEFKSIPIIILTVDNDRRTFLSCLKLGAKNYIIKPYDKDDVLSKIEIYLKP